ncbi:MAG: hypothetical protein K0R08_674 [Solimicrobium sp.]|nr:hypothetical protein [Solimicrobium sp.]
MNGLFAVRAPSLSYSKVVQKYVNGDEASEDNALARAAPSDQSPDKNTLVLLERLFERSTNLDGLLPEIAWQISRYGNFLMRLRLVSKAGYELVERNFLQSRFHDMNKLGAGKEPGSLSHVCEYYENMKVRAVKINIKSLRENTQTFVHYIASLAKNSKEKAIFLNLSDNQIGLDNQLLLTTLKALSSLKDLKGLDMTGNYLKEQGAELAKMVNITHLDISCNNLSPEGMEPISKMSQLKKLNVCHNGLGEEGAELVSKMANITNLDISANNLGPAGAKSISTMSQLKVLHIGGNTIKAQGAQHLSNLSQLKEVTIYWDDLNEKEKEELVSKIKTLKFCERTYNIY